MAKPLKTSQLIKSVKQRAMLPTNSKTFSDEDLIEILNEEMDTGIVPEVLKQHEEYYTTYEDIPFDTAKSRYKIPYRAIGNKLRDVMYVSESTNVVELSRISLEDLPEYQSLYNYGDSEVFYLEKDEVVFPAQNSGVGTIRMYFHMRPNSLVLESQSATIKSIDRVTGTIVVNAIPSTFSTTDEFDFIDHQSPNNILSYDLSSTFDTETNTTEMSFNASDIPEHLKVGDIVCKKQESTIPQIPVELHGMLAQRAAIHCLEALNDTEGLSNALRKLERMEKDLDAVLNNRVDGAPKKMVNRNGPIKDAAYKTGHKRRFKRRY